MNYRSENMMWPSAISKVMLSFVAMVGIISFAITDYLIAMDTIEKHTFSEKAIMGTYTLAQLLLIVGICNTTGGLLDAKQKNHASLA